jgi:hypothetical protein
MKLECRKIYILMRIDLPRAVQDMTHEIGKNAGRFTIASSFYVTLINREVFH